MEEKGFERFRGMQWLSSNAEMEKQAKMTRDKRKRLSQRNFPFDKWKKTIIVKVTKPQVWLCQQAVGAQKLPGRASSSAIYLQCWLCLHQSSCRDLSHLHPSTPSLLAFTQGAGSLSLHPPHKSLLACSGIQLLLVLLLRLWKIEEVGGEPLIICLNNTRNSC